MDISSASIAILVEQQYQEMEVWYPKFRFWEEGCEVSLIGPEKGATYLSKVGYPVEADEAASEVKGDDFDVVIIPGGFACIDICRQIGLAETIGQIPHGRNGIESQIPIDTHPRLN